MLDKSLNATSQYDSMSTEDLAALLCQQTMLPEDQRLPVDILLHIARVHAARYDDESLPRTAEESLTAFWAEYDVCQRLLVSEERDTPPIKAVGRFLRPIWRRVASVAAAVAISFILLTVTAYAAGLPIWSAVIEWTQDSFHYDWQENSGQEIIPGDPDLIMEKYGITDGGVPDWVPDGYVFYRYKDSSENPSLDSIYVSYQRADGWLTSFHATSYNPDIASYYIQSDNARIYRTNGIQYYIYPNGDRWSAVWMEDGCECSLHGPFTKRQLKNTLKAMHKEG